MTLREAEDRVCGKTNAQGGKVSRGKKEVEFVEGSTSQIEERWYVVSYSSV
jgi:hypothetical protein